MLELLKKKEIKFLRLLVDGGGCSGFQYKFSLEKEITDDDLIFQNKEAKIIIDKLSIKYLEGAVIDYKETMIKSSFLVVDNPKAELSCSCGVSFSPINKV